MDIIGSDNDLDSDWGCSYVTDFGQQVADPRDLVHGEGYGHLAGRTPKLPGVEIGAEDYRRLARLAKAGEVRLEIDSKVHFEDADHNA